ncbi:MAG: bi-domain-containing oxidoreductase, partial [Chloroflexota bacterium]
REGLISTADVALKRLDQPLPLGYSSAGTIVELGPQVQGFQVGDRVACAGGGYAVHAEYAVVPQNLLAHLPDEVGFEVGAFGTLGSIALHGFRLGQPQLGERVVIVGLGLLGLLAAGIARTAGCEVIGIDLDPQRVALAKELGYHAYLREGAEEAVAALTQNLGADLTLICADTPSNDPVELAGEIAADRGRVVAVGVVGLEIPRRLYFAKELNFKVSRSYGPGRYDSEYEQKGRDYPFGYVRWTAGRNLAAFVNLLADQLDIAPIITHRIPIKKASDAYDLITGKKAESFLGVVLTYPQAGTTDIKSGRKLKYGSVRTPVTSKINLGVFGDGIFASAVLFPVLKANKAVNLVGVASGSGLSAQHAAKKFGFGYAASDAQKVISDPTINTLAILTRHNLHASQTLEGLQAGKNVFVEKPMAINLKELDEISLQLEKPDCPMLMVGFNRRFAPLAVKMHSFLAQRTEPLVAHYRVNAGNLPPKHWHYDPDQGAGRIISEGCHFIDFLIWLVGDEPHSVTVERLPDNGKYNEDNVVMTYAFVDGSIGSVTYLANGDKAYSKERIEVFTGGRIAVLEDYRSLEMVHNGRRRVTKSRFRQDKGHSAVWKSFTETITKSGQPPIPYAELISTMQTTFKSVEALRTGEKKIIYK